MQTIWIVIACAGLAIMAGLIALAIFRKGQKPARPTLDTDPQAVLEQLLVECRALIADTQSKILVIGATIETDLREIDFTLELISSLESDLTVLRNRLAELEAEQQGDSSLARTIENIGAAKFIELQSHQATLVRAEEKVSQANADLDLALTKLRALQTKVDGVSRDKVGSSIVRVSGTIAELTQAAQSAKSSIGSRDLSGKVSRFLRDQELSDRRFETLATQVEAVRRFKQLAPEEISTSTQAI